MNLIDDFENGCVYHTKRWSGDCGEFSSVDEKATDALFLQAANRIKKLEAALERIAEGNNCRECGGEYQADIAREALE